MKIYLAARFPRIEEMRKYADELTEDGHEVTASWVYGGEEGLTFSDIALLDVSDVIKSDALVCFTEPYGSSNVGGGRHSEFGVALALRKKLYLVGEREQVFHWWPSVIQFPQFKHLRNHLKGRKCNDSQVKTLSTTSPSTDTNSTLDSLLSTSGEIKQFSMGFSDSAEKLEKSQKKLRNGSVTGSLLTPKT